VAANTALIVQRNPQHITLPTKNSVATASAPRGHRPRPANVQIDLRAR